MAISVKDEVLIELVTSLQLVAPRVATRQAATQADIADGGTVVIAGLRQENFQNDEQGVPWLSKIPVLGWLFKNDLTETARRELVVFLTAKVVPNPGQAAVPPSALPAAPGAPAPPGPSGQAPKVAPTPVSAVPTLPSTAPTTVATASAGASPTALATMPSREPAGRPTPPADPMGER